MEPRFSDITVSGMHIVHPWGRWATTTEDYIMFYSCQPKIWHRQKFPETGKLEIEKILPGPRRFTFFKILATVNVPKMFFITKQGYRCSYWGIVKTFLYLLFVANWSNIIYYICIIYTHFPFQPLPYFCKFLT